MLLCSLLGIGPAQAAVVADPPARIPLTSTTGDSLRGLTAPVFEVRARRIGRQQSLDRRPQFATVLEASRWSGGVISASTVLGALVGVNVREAGGIGSYSSVSIRGSGAGQVPIFLDGVPLASPSNNVVDLADVNLAMLDRIEVYRSGAPVVIGGSSLGGAIHLHSARNATPWAQVTIGSHQTRKIEAAGSSMIGAWLLASRGRWIASQGDWDFLDDRGTRYNADDDAWRRRINNDVSGGGMMVSATREGDWSWHLSEVVDGRTHGVPGLSVLQSEEARSATLSHQAQAKLERDKTLPGRWRSLDVYHRMERQSFSDLDGDLGLGKSDRRDVVHTVGLDATGSLTGAPTETWRFESSWSQTQGEDDLQTPRRGRPQTRWSAAFGAQPTFDVAGERVQLSPGARGLLHHDVFHGTSTYASLPSGPVESATAWDWSAQVGLRVRLAEEAFLKANLGRYTRVPTLLEQFGLRALLMGNPRLRAENGIHRDIGVVWHQPARGRRLELTWFDNDHFDLIQYRRVSAGLARAVNVGRAAIRGLEVSVDSGVMGAVRNQINFTALSALDRTDDQVAGGKQLPDRPRYEISYRLQLAGGPFDFGYDLAALGSAFAESGERTPIAARVLHGLSLAARWSWMRWDLRLDNLADTRSFDLWGYPLPGRTFTLSLSTGGFRAP